MQRVDADKGRLRRALALTLVMVVGAAVGPSIVGARERLPTLTKSRAAYYTKQALRRNFGGNFTNNHGYTRSCGRVSRTRVRCRVRWEVGDLGYRGPVTIWLSRGDGQDEGLVIWNYAYTITRTDFYCVDVGGSNCTKVFRVR